MAASEAESKMNQGGWTLVEMMMAIALIAIITPAITYLFAKVSQGMASDEMHTELQLGNQAMLNRIDVRLSASHHFFFADSSGVSFLGRLTLSAAPATVAGMTLSQAQTGVSGSLSTSVTDFQSAYVGNALLFGTYAVPETIVNSNGTWNAYTNVPVTVSSSPVTTAGVVSMVPNSSVTDQYGNVQRVIIDLYRFYFYYLTASNTKQLYDATDYSLIEWQSIQFADYHEITNYDLDSTLEGNILAGLKSNGITVAWDPTQSDPSQAFVTFGNAAYGTPSTGVTALNASYNIPMATYTNVSTTRSGILTTGFRYGICPNSKNWKSCPVQVPLFAPVTTAGVAFPNGFEVSGGNNATGREVMIRSVWVAEGANAPDVRAIYSDINMVDEISDNW